MATLNRSNKQSLRIKKILKNFIIRRKWKIWRLASKKAAKSISSIFRDLEKTLKNTVRTYSPAKKVRFNVDG